MSSSGHKIWSRFRSRPSCEYFINFLFVRAAIIIPHVLCYWADMSLHRCVILSQCWAYLFWTGLLRPWLQAEEENDRRHCLQIQTVRYRHLSLHCISPSLCKTCMAANLTFNIPDINVDISLDLLLLSAGSQFPRWNTQKRRLAHGKGWIHLPLCSLF